MKRLSFACALVIALGLFVSSCQQSQTPEQTKTANAVPTVTKRPYRSHWDRGRLARHWDRGRLARRWDRGRLARCEREARAVRT